MDQETINYLRLTGRDERQLALIEAYMKAMGMWHDEYSCPSCKYNRAVCLVDIAIAITL